MGNDNLKNALATFGLVFGLVATPVAHAETIGSAKLSLAAERT
jgi:hypothetical protein